MPEEPKARGIWAELYVRDFLALPFVSEFVFRILQALDAGTQKEVADLLIAHSGIGTFPGVGILMSQKTQQDVLARDAEKTLSWALKEAKKARPNFVERYARGAESPSGAITRAGDGSSFPRGCLKSTTASSFSKCWSASI